MLWCDENTPHFKVLCRDIYLKESNRTREGNDDIPDGIEGQDADSSQQETGLTKILSTDATILRSLET